MERDTQYHAPVMVLEVLEYLAPRPGGLYVDCTLGGGGHTEALLEHPAGIGEVLGIDQDAEALEASGERLARFGKRFRALRGNFGDLPDLLNEAGVLEVDGVLMDLGVSSRQLTGGGRGFSFRAAEPLDMRMDASSGETAAQLLARLSERELSRVLREYGEERWAARIAAFLVKEREASSINTTDHLARVVAAAVPRGAWPPETHVATRTFQALRLAVNQELEVLEQGLAAAVQHLRVEGRVVVISYHSLEDRIVKRRFQELGRGCTCPPRMPKCVCGRSPMLHMLTRRPITASPEEVSANPRARSAKLRAGCRL
ncbi:MAG TPA: 16S rRNA (cytosine(1402)-N(4))-methyltransferase RsmH [Armatimonadota bacterium]|jgi:16S rRNA (cytosine1402-N4)-methyltransferase